MNARGKGNFLPGGLEKKFTFGSVTMRWVTILKEALSTYKINNIDEKYVIKIAPWNIGLLKFIVLRNLELGKAQQHGKYHDHSVMQVNILDLWFTYDNSFFKKDDYTAKGCWGLDAYWREKVLKYDNRDGNTWIEIF